ncbi:hypothetical protein P4305_18890 [Bacillus thuringiensis]|nr:hypothetical protein [Bacillus thuringiensis]
MVVKQHSFKVDLEIPDEKMIHEFLQGKPTTYIVVEAMKLYIRTEKAKEAAIENMFSNMKAGMSAQPSEQVPQVAAKNNDSIKDFDF